jgi:ribonucleoside-diphosphate reductase alpha chain/ribonucleoside-triphosphate reductase
VSSGVHFSHSPYYIRRIRINSADPLSKALVKNGFKWYPENGERIEEHKTKVFEFPIQAPEGRTKFDVSAIDQLELYKIMMQDYVDHNASNTIHVRDDEWEDVIKWVYNNWNSIVGVTFLSLSDSFYQLMPLEAITKEEYDVMVSNTPTFNPSTIREFEQFEDEFELEDGCDTGVCPIR